MEAILYCLEVENYNTWQLTDGYDRIRGRIMHSRTLLIGWGKASSFVDPPSYDSLTAVSYMIRAFVPELAPASLQQSMQELKQEAEEFWPSSAPAGTEG
ncbi:hypothetical protein WJX72_001895 [[Myrmecia] bisecta]|uniref:Uncharacterized protein n=1 Tax=[Myrmecia] bisecta TaxID=41462 RepID=A0AAW1Q3B7_9CHLO